MRRLALALALFALAPAAAHAAAPVRIVHDGRFNMVGFHWRGGGTPWYRTHGTRGWSSWHEADDVSPSWVGASSRLQVRAVGRVRGLRATRLWSPHVALPARGLSMAGSPLIVTRAQWEADESIRRAAPLYAPTLQLAVVHHTVTPNSYSCSDSASIVRGIETYHVKSNGWNDIGYNFLVDKCGNVFEGRYGGVDKNVIGAHSEGFNTGTVGIALIGTYTSSPPPAIQLQALEKLLAWRLDVAHVDPLSKVVFTSLGNSKYRAGTKVTLAAVSGHRDTYLTECPGSPTEAQLPAVAQAAAQIGLPKLYAPAVSGTLGGALRFTGRLTSPLGWTITVADPLGVPVATDAGSGMTVDWTWDSSAATAGRYTWTMSAGSTVRAATGTLGAAAPTAPQLTVTKLKASPAALDGTLTPSATVTYTLGAAANVTGELVNATGTAVQLLFAADQQAGTQSYVFSAASVPDGNYTIRVTARDPAGHAVVASVPVTVSRTLLGFSADVKLLSPNGDGRNDTATFAVALAQSANVAIALVQGTTSIPLFSGPMAAGDQDWAWSGETLDGSVVPDGAYNATITVGTPPLGVSRSVPLTIDQTAPTLQLVSFYPLRFRTNERVNVLGKVNGGRIATTARPGVFRVLFKGRTIRTLHVVVRDAAGNQSAPVDRPVHAS